MLPVELVDAREDERLELDLVAARGQSDGLPREFLGLRFFLHVLHCALVVRLEKVEADGFANAGSKQLQCFARGNGRLVVELVLEAFALPMSELAREPAHQSFVLAGNVVYLQAAVEGFEGQVVPVAILPVSGSQFARPGACLQLRLRSVRRARGRGTYFCSLHLLNLLELNLFTNFSHKN